MSARDVIAEAAWRLDREIAGAPLPAPAWATVKDNDPETAAIYETQAGVYLSALSAARFVVVPAEPTEAMAIAATARSDRGEGRDTDPYGLYRSIYRAMISAATTQEPTP